MASTLARLLPFAIIILTLENVLAQEAYAGNKLFDCNDNSSESSGYACNGAERSCSTYALFHAQAPNYLSLLNISRLFNMSTSEMTSSNNITIESAELQQAQPVLIPLQCGCTGNHSQANLRYKLSEGDTYFSLTKVFQGLTSCQALVKQNTNPEGIYSLSLAKNILIPLRCACPTTEQIKRGFNHLLSYAVKKGDTLDSIAEAFNTSIYDIVFANTLQGSNPTVIFHVSLLVPLKSKPVILPVMQAREEGSPQPRGISTTNPKKRVRLEVGAYVGIAVGTVAITSAIVVSFLLARRKQSLKKLHLSHKNPDIPRAEDKDDGERKSTSNKVIITNMITDLSLTFYTFEQLQKATDNFNPDCRIEGSVYCGTFSGVLLAIKKTKADNSKELRILHKLHHVNLIGFLGVCIGDDHSYMVFEYAENGSLSDWLHGGLAMKNKFISSCSRFLTWNQRLQICLDVARGLQYIHTCTQPCYVHKDIKCSNILLNGDFNAKIANFGMAKSSENTDIFTKHISGTHGYMAPEYLSDGLVTPMMDVYAFGVILLEILSGKPAVSKRGKNFLLADTISPLLEGDNAVENLRGWMDQSLHEVYCIDQALALAKLALSCVEKDPSMRPAMDEITFRLSRLT
ncbi:hypothetical protein SUGI_0434780 [Cryptomeria japonica]|uniref:protein LYK5-like n=1 Tax=Cryptomeria japonica TaxID=3369 RepID=UPI0024089DF0|nr:protein LYK5-like [Cryptomeria japonica]GLJ23039.1 hypothetical protein SUGI_0434780 [Cryptomeria japonica]